MFKILRDALTKPKDLVKYRTKKGWFVFLYMCLICLVFALSTITSHFKYTEFTNAEKTKVISAFTVTSDADIVDGSYVGDSVSVTFGSIDIDFVSDSIALNDYLQLSQNENNFIVYKDHIYLSFSTAASEISKLSDLNANFNNVDLKTLNYDSAFFTGINELIHTYKPSFLVSLYFVGFFRGMFDFLVYALIAFLLIIMFFQANKYMKKSQLFTMMIFASTGAVLVGALINFLNVQSSWIYLLLFVGFLPIYLLERELLKRIRLFQITQGMIPNNEKNNDNNDEGSQE